MVKILTVSLEQIETDYANFCFDFFDDESENSFSIDAVVEKLQFLKEESSGLLASIKRGILIVLDFIFVKQDVDSVPVEASHKTEKTNLKTIVNVGQFVTNGIDKLLISTHHLKTAGAVSNCYSRFGFT